MSPYRTQKVLPQKQYSEAAEEWEYIEKGILQRSYSACVCMTCKHFDYTCDRHCRTVLTCQIQQRLIPHGQHLNSRCPMWFKQIQKEVGWCPEAA